MKKRVLGVLLGAAILGAAATAGATPTTMFWTPASTDIQGFGVAHLGIDNYFTVFRKAEKGGGDFPTDIGLTVGILPSEKIQAEIGVDLFEPSDNPLVFNAKVGTPEDALCKGCPAINIGVFGVGTKKDVTNQNVFDIIVGKTIGSVGRVFAGYYSGNKKVLVDKDGNKENTGFMVGFDKGFMPTKQGKDEYSKLVLAVDYMSGKNALGGGGVGIAYYFTKDVALLTGPVWFNEEAINGKWKWSTQLDVNF